MSWLNEIETVNLIVSPINEHQLGQCLERSCAIGSSGRACNGDDTEIFFNN